MTEHMTAQEFIASGLQIRTSRGSTDYKAELLRQIREAELPEPTPEYQFHPTRRWRFDYAWTNEGQKVALEYEGGIFTREASHSSISGQIRDIEKGNEAILAGWVVIRVTAQTVANGTALRYIKRALKKAEASTRKSAKINEQPKFAEKLIKHHRQIIDEIEQGLRK